MSESPFAIVAHLLPLDTKNLPPKKQFYSSIFKIHENYNDDTLDNDIALIYVPDLLKHIPDVKPIKLATDEQFFKNLEGREITLMGFGRTGSFEPISENFKFVVTTVGESEECDEKYRGYDDYQHICVHTNGTGSSCKGDSGESQEILN